VGKTPAFNQRSLDAQPHARRLSAEAPLVQVDTDDAHRPGRVPRVARDVLAAQRPLHESSLPDRLASIWGQAIHFR
jgi:hypothetical protein